MTTYNTGNPVGSVDVRDLYDNVTGIRPENQTSPRLSEEDAKLVERLKGRYGSKKNGVITAIRGWCELLDAQERIAAEKED